MCNKSYFPAVPYGSEIWTVMTVGGPQNIREETGEEIGTFWMNGRQNLRQIKCTLQKEIDWPRLENVERQNA